LRVDNFTVLLAAEQMLIDHLARDDFSTEHGVISVFNVTDSDWPNLNFIMARHALVLAAEDRAWVRRWNSCPVLADGSDLLIVLTHGIIAFSHSLAPTLPGLREPPDHYSVSNYQLECEPAGLSHLYTGTPRSLGAYRRRFIPTTLPHPVM
jgi:hypothetical protein